MYLLETEQSFDSAHFLNDYQGKCRNLHGHRWRVIARISAGSLSTETQTRDMVIDFGDFKEALRRLTEALDHTLIIEAGSLRPKTLEALSEENFSVAEVPFRPTAERFSEFFYKQLKAQSFPVHSVSVYETPANCATYQEDT